MAFITFKFFGKSVAEKMSTNRDLRFERVSWNDRYMEMLFDMWEQNIPIMKFSHRYNATICSKMALDFQRVGFKIHWSKVNRKMNCLIRKYKAELKNRENPAYNKHSWPEFKRMHNIMSLMTANNIDNTDDTNNHSEDPLAKPSVNRLIIYIRLEAGDNDKPNFKTEQEDIDGQDQVPWYTPSVDEPCCKNETDVNDGLNEYPSNTTSVIDINYTNRSDTKNFETPLCKVETNNNNILNETPSNMSSKYVINYIKETEEPICKIETEDWDYDNNKPFTNNNSMDFYPQECSDSIRKQQLKTARAKHRSGAKYRPAVEKNK